VIYVDNAQGNGYGAGTALVRIAKNGKAELVPIHTPLSRTLPLVGAPGFPTSLYPALAGQRHQLSPRVRTTPESNRLRLRTQTIEGHRDELSERTVCERHCGHGPFLVVGAFDAFQGADLGVHLATKEMPAEESADANEIGLACGDALVRDSIAVSIGNRVTRRERTIYLLNRDGILWSITRNRK